jgi:2-methylisocitrate lyase-like PEP mutase family enzyme
VTGFEDALERALAYEQAGADAIFVEAPETEKQVAIIAHEIQAPKVFNWAYGGKSPTLDAEKIAELGYKFLLCPDVVFAVSKTLCELYGEVRRAGTYAALADRMVTFGEFNELVDLATVAELDRRFGQ